jgi:5-methylthioadenosine/S-adenosylhomocysteine deaminase
LTCNQVLQMATVAGAACAQLGHKVGSLTPGKEADIITLDARAPNTAGLNNVPGAIVTLMSLGAF